jgi:hypothetical protein
MDIIPTCILHKPAIRGKFNPTRLVANPTLITVRYNYMEQPLNKKYTVRAVECDYRSSDEEVYQALKRATAPLDRTWEKLTKARRIAIKFNQDWLRDRIVMHLGHRQQLVSDPVARATLRLLRERTTADLIAVDIGTEGIYHHIADGSSASLLPVFREYNVPYIEGDKVPTVWAPVPGGGLMFARYPLPQPAVEADAVVSVQKMKNHQFMGVTLCLKNLFALTALQPGGRPRIYYHHLVRMPYMLADLGRILDPALNIIDGLVTQAGMEWGNGEHPRLCNTLIAGDQVVATDTCGTYLMGHDPQADWLTPPFHRDRNALRVAADTGFGTVDLRQIDFLSEATVPVGEFFVRAADSRDMVVSWRRTTAEQALFYRDHQADFVKQYAGKYVLLQMDQVRWKGTEWNMLESRRTLSGANPDQGMWIKYVDEQEAEGEHFEVYEKTLQHAVFCESDSVQSLNF